MKAMQGIDVRKAWSINRVMWMWRDMAQHAAECHTSTGTKRTADDVMEYGRSESRLSIASILTVQNQPARTLAQW